MFYFLPKVVLNIFNHVSAACATTKVLPLPDLLLRLCEAVYEGTTWQVLLKCSVIEEYSVWVVYSIYIYIIYMYIFIYIYICMYTIDHLGWVIFDIFVKCQDWRIRTNKIHKKIKQKKHQETHSHSLQLPCFFKGRSYPQRHRLTVNGEPRSWPGAERWHDCCLEDMSIKTRGNKHTSIYHMLFVWNIIFDDNILLIMVYIS